MPTQTATLPDAIRADVETLWAYHDMDHPLQPTDVGIGLGSHDLGVATYVAHLYGQGQFPLVVFTGANAPTTIERFPRGEAVHYREHAMTLGVPDEAILVETRATNTAENIRFTRSLLEAADFSVHSATLVTRPYQQRRAYATAMVEWPSTRFVCASLPLALDDYVASIGDASRVVNMLVGDTQRIWVYANAGYAVAQEVPTKVMRAFHNLVAAGFTSRLLKEPA